VIFGSESGDIFALDARTGKTDWTVHTGGAVKGALAYDRGTLFADNYAGEVWAVDAGNGKVKWTAHTQGGGFLRGGGAYSTPAVAWGRVYLGGLDGRVYSYVEKTGELAWSHSTGAEVYSSPAVAKTPHSPPTVYIGSEDKHFYALDARTGAVRWDRSVGGIVLGSSSVVDETVYVSVIGPNIGTFYKTQKTLLNNLSQRVLDGRRAAIPWAGPGVGVEEPLEHWRAHADATVPSLASSHRIGSSTRCGRTPPGARTKSGSCTNALSRVRPWLAAGCVSSSSSAARLTLPAR